MGRIVHSLLWASAILFTAIISSSTGMSDAASFSLIAGLTGIAWGALQTNRGCARPCLR